MTKKKPDKKNDKRTKGKRGGRIPGAGRKPFVPTPEELERVRTEALYGVPAEQIRYLIRGGISKETFYKNFKDALDLGRAQASQQVGRALMSKAIKGKDTTALIWLSKSRMGYKAAEEIDIKSSDGSMTPKAVEVNVDMGSAVLEALKRKYAAKDSDS